MAVSVRYPAYPGGVDVGSILGAFDSAFDRSREQKYERELQPVLERYADWQSGLQQAPQSLASLATLVPPQAQTSAVQRAPLPAPVDPATARVDQAFTASGGPPSIDQMTAYIAKAAHQRGIDPSVAVKVARSEGLAPGVWQSNVTKNGRREPSYGPFQMLVGGGDTGFPSGLGNAFMEQTGLDPSDPANWQKSVDFALDTASKSGWGQWYGAKAAGIGNMQGIGGAQTAAAPAQVADASGQVMPAADPSSLLPPRDVMIGLLKNPQSRALGIELARSAQKIRAGQSDPQAQVEYQIAVEKLKALRDPQSKLINSKQGIYDPNTGQWIAPPEGLAGNPETGLTPQMMRNPKTGETIYVQPTKDGRLLKSDVPPGFEPYDPYQKSFMTKQGQVEGETAGNRVQAQSSLNSTFSSLDRLASSAQDIASDPSLGRITGWTGMVPNAPGGKAASVQARLNTLKTQVGFSVLQAMRDASKTGGALGAISDRENDMLQNALAALDQAQSEDDLRAELGKIVQYVQEAKARLQAGYDQSYGGVTSRAPASGNRTSSGVQWSIEE